MLYRLSYVGLNVSDIRAEGATGADPQR